MGGCLYVFHNGYILIMEGLQYVTKFVFILKNKDTIYLFDRNENIYTFLYMIQIKKNNQKLFTQKEYFIKDLYLNQFQISRFLKQLKNRFYLFLKKNHFLPF